MFLFMTMCVWSIEKYSCLSKDVYLSNYIQILLRKVSENAAPVCCHLCWGEEMFPKTHWCPSGFCLFPFAKLNRKRLKNSWFTDI